MDKKIDIKFKLTTRNLKCCNCSKIINGKQGYIVIIQQKGYYLERTIRYLCLKCWNRILKEIIKGRKQKNKRYKELLKRGILRKLNEKE